MNAVGVIVEYNPFHNGHAFHIEEAKKAAGADVVIAVMSGNFLQRGEPAFVAKWTRTEMALKAGVDIIFELPYAFATQKAETFANGAVSILEAARCSSLCFGSESGHINNFHHTLSFLEKNNTQYQERIKFHLAKGNSYPKASSLAFNDLSPNDNIVDLSKPNNILGYHYLKAVQKQQATIEVQTISRRNADYHDEHFSSQSIASATSIRKALFTDNNEMETIRQYVPETTYTCLVNYKEKYGLFHDWTLYWPFLKFRLIQSTAKQLKYIYEVEEGLENRLISSALKAQSFQEFMELLKTKRYTWTRLQRVCLHILTNTTKVEMNMSEEKATYLRLLGMTMNGKAYLNKNKSKLGLPIISKVSSEKNNQLELDIRASRVFSLGAPSKSQRILLDKEFMQPPFILN